MHLYQTDAFTIDYITKRNFKTKGLELQIGAGSTKRCLLKGFDVMHIKQFKAEVWEYKF